MPLSAPSWLVGSQSMAWRRSLKSLEGLNFHLRIPVQIRKMAPMEAAIATMAVTVSFVMVVDLVAASVTVAASVELLAVADGAMTVWVTSVVEGVGCSVTTAAGSEDVVAERVLLVLLLLLLLLLDVVLEDDVVFVAVVDKEEEDEEEVDEPGSSTPLRRLLRAFPDSVAECEVDTAVDLEEDVVTAVVLDAVVAASVFDSVKELGLDPTFAAPSPSPPAGGGDSLPTVPPPIGRSWRFLRIRSLLLAWRLCALWSCASATLTRVNATRSVQRSVRATLRRR